MVCGIPLSLLIQPTPTMTALPQAVPFGICTRSLGRAAGGHFILDILEVCARKGLWTIEVAYECLEVSHSHTF